MLASDKGRRPVQPAAPSRERPGVINRAVLSVLRNAGRPLGAREVQAVVEERLERKVSYDNIRKVLAAVARDPSSGITRTGRGRYAGKKGLIVRRVAPDASKYHS
jgi:hypothetical protein